MMNYSFLSFLTYVSGQLLNPKLDIQLHKDLLLAVRLLVSEDHCEGRFVFGRQLPVPSKKVAKDKHPSMVSRVADDNSKSHLQTLLARAGHGAPQYKTKQLKNNQFRSTVFFNGLDFVGRPCSNKKLAEKDAASEALLWLKGESHQSTGDLHHMSMLLKKSNKSQKRKRTWGPFANWGFTDIKNQHPCISSIHA